MTRLTHNYVFIALSISLSMALSFDLLLPTWLARTIAIASLALICCVIYRLTGSSLSNSGVVVINEARRQFRIIVVIGCAGLLGSAEILLADTGLTQLVLPLNLLVWLLALGALGNTIMRIWLLKRSNHKVWPSRKD